MNSISIEFLPFVYFDVVYLLNRTGSIKILSVHFNGSRLQLTPDQTKSLIEEIRFIIQEDFENGENQNEYFFDN